MPFLSRQQHAFGGLFALLIGLFFLYMIVREWSRGVREVFVYRPVSATVIAYTPADPDADTPERQKASIDYQYTFGGRTFGATFPPTYSMSMARYTQPILTVHHRLGESLAAYVDPDNPSISTLAPVIEPFPLSVLIFIVPFLLLGVWLARHGLRGAVPPELKPVGSGGTILVGGPERLFLYSTLSAAGAFAHGLVFRRLRWQASLALGFVIIALVPLLTWAIGWLTRHRLGVPVERLSSETAGNRKEAAVMVAVTLGWLGIGVAVLVGTSGSLYRQWDAKRRFVATEGEVTASRSRWTGDWKGRARYEPVIQYRYGVHGSSYESKRYSFTGSSQSREEAERTRRDYPAGRKLAVYYDPERPDEAVLQKDLPATTWFGVLFLLVWLVIGSALLVRTIRLCCGPGGWAG